MKTPSIAGSAGVPAGRGPSPGGGGGGGKGGRGGGGAVAGGAARKTVQDAAPPAGEQVGARDVGPDEARPAGDQNSAAHSLRLVMNSPGVGTVAEAAKQPAM